MINLCYNYSMKKVFDKVVKIIFYGLNQPELEFLTCFCLLYFIFYIYMISTDAHDFFSASLFFCCSIFFVILEISFLCFHFIKKLNLNHFLKFKNNKIYKIFWVFLVIIFIYVNAFLFYYFIYS